LCAVVSIGKLGASVGQLEYYERQVAAGAEEYYAGRGEVPGVWIGTGLRRWASPMSGEYRGMGSWR
jgi:hypothetical protein